MSCKKPGVYKKHKKGDGHIWWGGWWGVSTFCTVILRGWKEQPWSPELLGGPDLKGGEPQNPTSYYALAGSYSGRDLPIYLGYWGVPLWYEVIAFWENNRSPFYPKETDKQTFTVAYYIEVFCWIIAKKLNPGNCTCY